MEFPVELQKPLHFHIFWLILATLFIVVAAFLLYYSYKNWNIKKEKKLKVKKPPRKNIPLIRKKYLLKLDELEKNINNGNINNRAAYQKLSTIIRMFVYEMTGITVQNCTLEEIRTLRMPRLTKLVEEYYEPEFSSLELGDALASLSITRKVVSAWH